MLGVLSEIDVFESMNKRQNTQYSTCVTPIFVADQLLSPDRGPDGMVIAVATLVGGVLMVLSRRAFASVKKQRGERLKSASITP